MTGDDKWPHKYKLVPSEPSFTGSKWPRLRRFLTSFFTWSWRNSDIVDVSNNKVVLKLAEAATRNASLIDSEGKFVLRPLETKTSSVSEDSPILQHWSWLDPKPDLWPVYSIVDKSENVLGAYNGIAHDRLSYFGPEIYMVFKSTRYILGAPVLTATRLGTYARGPNALNWRMLADGQEVGVLMPSGTKPKGPVIGLSDEQHLVAAACLYLAQMRYIALMRKSN